MSPEQIALTFPEFASGKKFPKPDNRTDLYSLGVLWYYCLTGVNPFLVDSNRTATLKKHFGTSPVPPSQLKKEIPKYLDTIILKLLEKNPENRYTNAAEVVQHLSYFSKKPYSVIPSTLRKYYLPDGEWIGQSQVWKPLKEKWDSLSSATNEKPSIAWIVGTQGQGKTKLLEHFKSYVQTHPSHAGHTLLLQHNTPEALQEWASELEKLTQNFDQPLAIAIDNFARDHRAWLTLEPLFEKIRYTARWNSSFSSPWLFVFTISSAQEKKSVPDLEEESFQLKNFDLGNLRELIEKISPHKEATHPEKLIQKLKNHTDGNPRFITALLQELGTKDLLWNDSGAWHPILFQTVGIDFDKLAIPKDQEKLLLKNLKECRPAEKKLLGFLSCFSSGAKANELPAPETLSNLLTNGLLIADEKGRYFFKNPFLQRTLYEKIFLKQKQKYHQQIAALFKHQNRPAHHIAYHLAKTADKTTRLEALHTLALFHEWRGKIAEALENRKEQFNLLSKSPLPQRLTVALHIIKLLSKLKVWDEALEWIEKHSKQTSKSKALIGRQAALLREKGMIFLQQHKLEEARKYFEKAYQLISKSKNHLKEQLILQNTIAKTWLEEGKLDKAIALYQTTHKAARQLKAKEKLEITNNDLGYAYLLNHDSKNAIHYLSEDLKIYSSGTATTKAIRCHYILGSCFRRLKRNFNEAIKEYQRAADLAKDIQDNDWLMRAYNGLAATYLDSASLKGGQNSYKQALRYFEESLALCQFLKKNLEELDFETAALHLNIGNVYKEIGNYSKARDSFNTIVQVLNVKPKKHPQDLVRLCETYLALAECHAAEKKFKTTEELLNKAWGIAKNGEGLKEHQFAIQLVWAEAAKEDHKLNTFKKHFATAKQLQRKHNIHPTPTAEGKLRDLEKSIF